LYEDFNIPDDIKITESDFLDLAENPFKMQDKINIIKNKIENINKIIIKESDENKKEYEDDIKGFLNIDKEKQKRKLKVLEVINIAG